MAFNPSERIKIIAEVSRRLAGEDWPLIDLTLRQFGLPTTDSWPGSSDAYVIEMIEDASDDDLISLAYHIGVDISAPEQGIVPPFWKDGHLRVFLSHLSEHREFAGELKEAMEYYGLTAFVAHDDIEPTAEWQSEIETALSTCEVLIALLHAGFKESNWTDQEVGFAMGRSVPVFSIRFDQDPYGFIGRFQAFNGNGKKTHELAKEIFDVLRQHKQTQRRMAEILVARFELSINFQNAKDNMTLLEELNTWNANYSERITKAVENNGQKRILGEFLTE
jgi:hypothetical protein